MKSILILPFVLVLFLGLLAQWILQTTIDSKIQRFNEHTYVSAQKARIDGYFTNENINDLKSKLIVIFPDVEEEEIITNVTTTPKYRTNVFDEREIIEFEIYLPIKHLTAVSFITNVSGYVGISGFVSSELLP